MTAMTMTPLTMRTNDVGGGGPKPNYQQQRLALQGGSKNRVLLNKIKIKN